MTIRLPLPIDPASTGADWAFDFTFTALDGQPENWVGDQVTIVFVPKVAAERLGNAFELTSEGGGVVVLDDGAAIRVAAVDMADRLPGAYDFELIRRREGGAKIREVVGTAVIERGLEQMAAGVAAGATALTGSAGVYRIERSPNGVRVERGGGAQGDDAYRVALREGFQGSRQEWLASLVGQGGASAYELAVADGFEGTVEAWLASLQGRTPTEQELAALVEPRVAEAVGAALAELIPTIPDPVLSALRFRQDVAVGTVLFTIAPESILPGALVSISPSDGRLTLTGNQQDGFKVVRGATAWTAGDLDLAVRQRFQPATNGPLHAKTFTLMVMAADRYMVGLTRIKPNSGANLVAAAGTERKMSVFVYGAPQYATNGYRFHFSGFASTEGGNSPQETVLPGNDTVIHGVWAIIGAAIVNGAVVGGTRYRLTFGGANGVTIASGANGAWTDEANFLANVVREGNVVVATEYSTAVGQNQIPNARIQKHRGERIWGAAAAVSLAGMLDDLGAPCTPALDTLYGLVGQPQFYGPDLEGHKGWNGGPVIVGMVDSVGESRQEFSGSADDRGNVGELRRWLDVDDPVHHRTPHYLIGMAGAGSVRELAANALKRWDNLDQLTTWNGGLPPFTKIVDQLGQNDFNAVYATMRANHKGAVTRVKARYPGIGVVGFGVLPRTSSTDYYATRENQTRVSGNEWPNVADVWGSGFKWQLEAAREALLDGELSGYISTRPYWYDAAYPGTWPTATITSLAAQAGTDGVATYSHVVLTQKPMISDALRWGAGYAGVGFVTDVEPSPGGGWRAALDRSTNTIVAVAGSPAVIAPTNDQVHPQPTEIMKIVAAIPQSEKAKLAA